MVLNALGQSVYKFRPIHPDEPAYTQAGMTIQEMCAQANGLSLAIQSITGTSIALTGGLGQWGSTPLASQYSTSGGVTGYTSGTSTALTIDGTFTGGTGATAYTISDVVSALKQLGILTS